MTKAERSRNLRYKRSILEDLNIEAIRDFLWEVQEECDNIAYSWDDENILDALDGDEEDAYEFKMMFSDLSADCDQLVERFGDEYITEHFDDFFTGLAFGGNLPFNTFGWDSYETDYFRLTRFESELAASESGKRLKRLTKDELISTAGQCLGIALSYLNLRYKYDYLKATFDVLKGEHGAILKTVKDIETLYEKVFDDYDGRLLSSWSDEVRAFDQLLNHLPERLWVE